MNSGNYGVATHINSFWCASSTIISRLLMHREKGNQSNIYSETNDTIVGINWRLEWIHVSKCSTYWDIMSSWREAFLGVYLTRSTNDCCLANEPFFLCNFIIYINNLIIIIMEDGAHKIIHVRDVHRYSMCLASVFRTSFWWVSLYNASMVLIALDEQSIHQSLWFRGKSLRNILEFLYSYTYIIYRVLITILALVSIADRITIFSWIHLK